jgi:hypothetical protein
MALLEVNNENKRDNKRTEDINTLEFLLSEYKNKKLLLEMFGREEFFEFGLNTGFFMPAIRLNLICSICRKDEESVFKENLISLKTPFLPNSNKILIDDYQYISSLQEENDNIINTVRSQMNNPEFMFDHSSPITTLSKNSFTGCADILRGTNRLISTLSSLVRINKVVVLPEITSPMGYSGISSAFCLNYLGALNANKLKTAEDRAKYKKGTLKGVASLLQQCKVAMDSGYNEMSGTNIALAEFACGYRTGNFFAEHVSDIAAQAEGARKVYSSLSKTLPSFFKNLAPDRFITAEEIAYQVEAIGKSIDTELKELKITIKNLSAELEYYKNYVKGLTNLLEKLDNLLDQVKNKSDLYDFQKNSNALIETMKLTANDLQRMTLKSLQGLISTAVSIQININTNANVKGEINLCSNNGVGIK